MRDDSCTACPNAHDGMLLRKAASMLPELTTGLDPHLGKHNAMRCFILLFLLVKSLDVDVDVPCNWQVTVQTPCKGKQDCTKSRP